VLDRGFTILQTFQCGSSLTSQFDYLSLSTVHALAIHTGFPLALYRLVAWVAMEVKISGEYL